MASDAGLQPMSALAWWRGGLPGLVLCLLLGIAAQTLAHWAPFKTLGLGGLTLAVLTGAVACNLLPGTTLAGLQQGVGACRYWLLRLGVASFGLRLTLDELARIGLGGLIADLLIVLSSFALAMLIGRRWLGLDRDTALLIGAGHAICGASAVAATGSVIGASACRMALASLVVTLFGSLSMLLYPWLFSLPLPAALFPSGEAAFGCYIGATVHELSQVLAAAQSIGPLATETALLAKLARVLMLAPLLLCLASWACQARAKANGGAGLARWRLAWQLPWFVSALLLLASANSLGWVADEPKQTLLAAGNGALAAAMVAAGMGLRLDSLRALGRRPFVLGLVLWIWLVVGGALLARVACQG